MSERLGSMFIVQATAMKGVSVEKLGAALEAALRDAIKTPPSEEELVRAKNTFKKGFYHRLESIGDRASLIGTYFLHTGRGNFLEEDYVRYEVATSKSVAEAATRFVTPSKMFRLDATVGKKSETAEVVGKTEK
jgi:zinc protease